MKLELKDFILAGLVIILMIVLIPKMSFASSMSPEPASSPGSVSDGRRCNDPIPIGQTCPANTHATSYSDDGTTKTCCEDAPTS